MSKDPSTESERRKHVRTAIADNRIEGIPPSPEVEEICAAYIRGEIDAGDLVEVYKKGQHAAKFKKSAPGKIQGLFLQESQIAGKTVSP